MAETRRTSERRKTSVSMAVSSTTGKDWDGTINDLTTMKYNDEELKARRESFSSKNIGKGRSKFYDDILKELSPAIKQSPQASPMGRNLLDVTSPFNLDKENGRSITNSRRASDVVVPDVNHASSFRSSMTPDNVFDSKISFAVISSDEQIAHIRSMCESLLPADDKRQRLDEGRDGRRTILVEIVDDFAKILQRYDLEISELQKQKESLLSDFISSKEQSVRLTKDCSQLRVEFASLRFEFEKYRSETDSLISLLNKQLSRLSVREAHATALPTATITQEDRNVALPSNRQSRGMAVINTASWLIKIFLLVALFAFIFVALGAFGFLFVDSIPYKFDDLGFDFEC